MEKMNLANILRNIPIQILCLDRRFDLWIPLIHNLVERGFTNIHPFIVGDGLILNVTDYDFINPSPKLKNNWIYGTADESRYRHWCAHLSHRQIIKRAKVSGWDKFLLLEDDSVLTDRFTEVVESNLQVPYFDLLYLGWWKKEHLLRESEDRWNSCREPKITNVDTEVTGLHGVIINSSIYDILLDYTIDMIQYDIQLLNINIVKLLVEPRIIHLKSSYSYCEQEYCEREKI